MNEENPWLRLGRLARSQAGAFTTAQASRCGIPQRTLHDQVRRGRLRKLHPRVWASTATPETRPLLEHAALLRLGGASTLSHLSAGHFYGLVREPDEVWLTIPLTHRAPPHGTGLRVLRSRRVEALPVTDGRRVTPPARTVVDLAACLARSELAAAFLTATQRELCSVHDIDQVLGRIGTPYPGTADVRAVLAEFDPGMESILGAQAWALLSPAIPGLQRGVAVRAGDGSRRVCDLAVPELRLDIEVDSWAWHGSKAQRRADTQRDRALAAVGWSTIRLVTDDVRRSPERTRAEMVALVARRAQDLAA